MRHWKSLFVATSMLSAVASCTVGSEGAGDEEVLSRDEFIETYIAQTYDDEGNEILTYDEDERLESWDEVDILYRAYVEAKTDGEVTSEAVVGWRYGYILWPSAQATNLTYCVSNAFGGRKSQVVNAMAQATSAWEATARVDYKYLSQYDGNCTKANNSVSFNVVPVSETGFFAAAFFPNYGRADRQLFIGPLAFDGRFPLAGILRHELGHTLGLRHETIRYELVSQYGTKCMEDIWFRTLTAYDELSVMTTPACLGIDGMKNKTLSLSSLDKSSIRKLYP